MVWRNPQLSVEEVAQPTLRNEDDVVIETLVCGICGSDVHASQADANGYVGFAGPARLPVILGHEFTGRVVEVGRGVRSLRPGQIVAAESIAACFSCSACRDGHLNQCERVELVGLTVDGALARYIRVNAAHCYSVEPLLERFSESLGCELGSLLEPVGCAYNALCVNVGGIKQADRVAVFGAGPIGLGAVALAHAAGASLVVAFDVIDERVALAKKLGADAAFNLATLATQGVTPRDVLSELTHGRGVTIALEAAGAAELFPDLPSLLATRGTLVYVGRTATTLVFDPNPLVSGALRIIGSRGHAGYGIFPALIKMIADGTLNLAPLITARVPFDAAASAIKQAWQRRDGKVLVRIRDF
jgi:threonine dehydrogenase-like Zn-dependent dehydrogenase